MLLVTASELSDGLSFWEIQFAGALGHRHIFGADLKSREVPFWALEWPVPLTYAET